MKNKAKSLNVYKLEFLNNFYIQNFSPSIKCTRNHSNDTIVKKVTDYLKINNFKNSYKF